MELLNSLLQLDQHLLLFLNAQSSNAWDAFWVFITKPLHWLPLFMVMLFFIYKTYKLKKTILIFLWFIFSGFTALFLVNTIKFLTKRTRPVNDSAINESLRIIIEQNGFSFVSGHATVSFTLTLLLFWLFKKRAKWRFLLFVFPILFAYSRIYLALHYPLDILFGLLLGFFIAKVFYIPIKRVSQI